MSRNINQMVGRYFGRRAMQEAAFTLRSLVTILSIIGVMLMQAPPAATQSNAPKAFASPQDAVAALITAAKKEDASGMLAVLGSETKQWITSGDPVQDRQGLERFVAAFDEKNGIEKEGDARAVLVIGVDAFPFPFPVVKTAKGWAFDPERGREELLNRRIGRNELNTVQVLLAVVDAQLDYAGVDRNGDGVLEYAAKLKSTEGKQDGLYLPTAEGAPTSPLGPLVAEAVREGYGQERPAPESAEKPAYHGYHFKLLTRQGADAPGGAQDYIVGGKMIGGFAVLAYPARYRNSGVMSFMVSHEGTVYDADLGPETAEEARAIDAFNPGKGWQKVAQ
ncbi:MAG: DUF2950 domain-containing protein [Hyphomicrobiales bacterium]|nr:DUF2950 domain-containing protein [Hyphomicrobiales bacterium]